MLKFVLKLKFVLGMFVLLSINMMACTATNQKNAKSSQSKKIPSEYKNQNSYFYYLMSQLQNEDEKSKEIADYFDLALKKDNDSSFLWTNKAYVEARDGNIEEARVSAMEALRLNPKSAETLFLLGKISSFEKDSLAAINHFKKSLVYDNENEEVYQMMSREYYQLNDFRNAERSLKQCIQKIPDSVSCMYYLATIYTEKQRYNEAIQYYTLITDLYPDQVKILQTLAEIHFERKNYKESLEVYKKIFRINPDDVGVQIRIGLLYYHLEEVAFAIEVFEKIRKRFPGSDRVNYFLGLMYLDREAYVPALEAFSRVKSDSSFFKQAIAKQFAILKEQNRADEVALVLGTHLKDMQDPWLHQSLGAYLNERRQYKEAIDVLSDGIKKFGSDEDLLFERAMAYEEIDEWQQSKKDLETLLENHPKSAKAYNFLAYSLADRDQNLEEAFELAQKAFELEPSKAYITDTLGWIYFKMGETEKALVYLKKAALLDKKHPTILEHLADVYVQLKDKKSARQYYEKALNILNDLPQKQNYHLEQIEDIENKLSEF